MVEWNDPKKADKKAVKAIVKEVRKDIANQVKKAMKDLQEKIDKTTKDGSWEGVDVDAFMDEVRGREPEDES